MKTANIVVAVDTRTGSYVPISMAHFLTQDQYPGIKLAAVKNITVKGSGIIIGPGQEKHVAVSARLKWHLFKKRPEKFQTIEKINREAAPWIYNMLVWFENLAREK